VPGPETAPHKIRKLREDQLKTQQQVASDAGIALSTYQRAEGGESVSRRTLRKLAPALLVEPEELLEAYKGRFEWVEAYDEREWPRSANLQALRASGKETKHRLIELAQVYGLYEGADPDTPEHKLFLQHSEEAFDVLRTAGFRSWKIAATYDFLLETGPAGLRALLGDEQGEADPGLIRSYADTLFGLSERGRTDLSTALGRVGLVRATFGL
jgi:transcriptional regulator with XRE-family HTH domain